MYTVRVKCFVSEISCWVHLFSLLWTWQLLHWVHLIWLFGDRIFCPHCTCGQCQLQIVPKNIRKGILTLIPDAKKNRVTSTHDLLASITEMPKLIIAHKPPPRLKRREKQLVYKFQIMVLKQTADFSNNFRPIIAALQSIIHRFYRSWVMNFLLVNANYLLQMARYNYTVWTLWTKFSKNYFYFY